MLITTSVHGSFILVNTLDIYSGNIPRLNFIAAFASGSNRSCGLNGKCTKSSKLPIQASRDIMLMQEPVIRLTVYLVGA